MRCYASGWVALALPVWTGLFRLFRVPRDVRVHWQSQCHPTVTFQSERYHAQEPFGAEHILRKMSRSAETISAVWGNPLRHGAKHVVFRERREEGTEVQGLGIELAKGVSEPPAVSLANDVSCVFSSRTAQQQTAPSSAERLPGGAETASHLGLDDEAFQPTWGDDSDV